MLTDDKCFILCPCPFKLVALGHDTILLFIIHSMCMQIGAVSVERLVKHDTNLDVIGDIFGIIPFPKISWWESW